MAREAGQPISRGSRTWLIRIPLGRDPESGTRKCRTKSVHGDLREAQSYLNRKLQERDIGRLPRSRHPTQPLPRPMADDCGEAPCAAEEFQRLRIVAAPICPARPRRPAAWVHRGVRHPSALRRDDRAGPLSENRRVHQRCTAVGLPAGHPKEDAGRRSLCRRGSASKAPEGNAGAQRRGVPAVP